MAFACQERLNRSAVTLIEVLVVFGIIGLLLIVLLPAIQSCRESSRKTACANNIRQIGLALQNFEAAHSGLPMGARVSETWGMCWCVDCIAYLEMEDVYNKLDTTAPNSGWLARSPKNADAVDNVKISAYVCPSTPLEILWPVDGKKVQMPSFVGIAGATSHDGFSENRVSTCCMPLNDGQISGGGSLVPNRAIRLRDVFDGLSNTLVVGECSDRVADLKGVRQRVDGAFPRGWPTGTNAKGTPPNYQAKNPPPAYNLTTIRYPPNPNNYSQPGIYVDHGANNPLTSAHDAGVNSLYLDGSVRFLADNIDLLTLKSMATRDDQAKSTNVVSR
jgi:prepilin-type processing-associated H-X9-DG protein